MRERGAIVSSAAQILAHGGIDLETLPGLIIRVVDEEMWRQRAIPQLSWRLSPEFVSFEAFVTASPLNGLGTTVDTLKDLCRHRKEALDAIDRATQRPHGGDRTGKFNNIQLAPSPVGTSESAALRRLRKDRPDLHARVLLPAGDPARLTAHGAMILAGFRPRTITVRPSDAPSMARTLRKHMDPEQRRLLADLLMKPEN